MQKYHIRLDEQERREICTYIQSSGWNAQGRTRAQILLDLDESTGSRQFSLLAISQRNGVSKVTVWNVCKRYLSGGIDAVIYRQAAILDALSVCHK